MHANLDCNLRWVVAKGSVNDNHISHSAQQKNCFVTVSGQQVSIQHFPSLCDARVMSSCATKNISMTSTGKTKRNQIIFFILFFIYCVLPNNNLIMLLLFLRRNVTTSSWHRAQNKPTSVPHHHHIDVKHRCSLPAKQSPSCVQHNMNGDIFKWENMGMTSLPVEVPDEAFLSNLAVGAGMGSGTNSHSHNV